MLNLLLFLQDPELNRYNPNNPRQGMFKIKPKKKAVSVYGIEERFDHSKLTFS